MESGPWVNVAFLWFTQMSPHSHMIPRFSCRGQKSNRTFIMWYKEMSECNCVLFSKSTAVVQWDQKVISNLNPRWWLRLKMETCQSAAWASPKALWDRGGRSEEIKRNIFFLLYYPSRTLSECDVPSSSGLNCWKGCHIFSVNVGPSVWWICSWSLSPECVWGNKDSKWKWAVVITEVVVPITVYLSALLS